MIRFLTATTLALALPLAALAAGSDSSPPKSSKTTKSCTQGKVWDGKSKKCVNPSRSGLSDDMLYQAVREFAYAEQYAAASAALDAMSDQQDDRVLTYRGFIARKSGDMEGGMAAYRAALAINPDNILTRSYMGQAFVEIGDIPAARQQLTEIRMRGGRSTWAEYSLRTAIETGRGYSY